MANIIEVRITASEYRRANGFELSPQVVIGITLIIGIVIALCVTYYILTFMPIKNFAESVTGDIMNDTIKQIQNAGLPVINRNVQLQKPTLIVKVNGQEKIKMKDPFTKYAGALWTIIYGGKSCGITWYSQSCSPTALLFNTTFSDLWNASISGTPIISLTNRTYTSIDNGTALTYNITFIGVSSVNVNITAIALEACTSYNISTTYYYVRHIVIATNLQTPLSLAVNDTITIQWIITGVYDNYRTRGAMMDFLSVISGTGEFVWGIEQYGNTTLTPYVQISNGTKIAPLPPYVNIIANISIPNHAYVEIVAYWDAVNIQSPKFLSINALLSTSGLSIEVFNESVIGMGGYRAYLLKIDVSLG